MKPNSTPSFARLLAVATVIFGVAGDASAQPGAAPQATVIVHATHFSVAGRAFVEVDAMASAIEALHPDAVAVHACGPGTTRALRAAVYRLRAWPLDLRVHDRGDAVCAGSATMALRVGQRGLVIDDDAVDRYWSRIEP